MHKPRHNSTHVGNLKVVEKDGKKTIVRHVEEQAVSKQELSNRIERLTKMLANVSSDIEELNLKRDDLTASLNAMKNLYDQIDE